MKTRIVRFKLLSALIALFLMSCGGGDFQIDHPQVKVFKFDGSIQCESQGISLEEMQADLSNAGIQVICVQKGHDGLSRTTVCGAGTGNINIFQISGADLSATVDLEFMRIETLSEYQDTECVPSSS